MQTKTPLLIGLSTLLCGSSKRNKHWVLAARSKTQRQRRFPDEITFWAFFGQVPDDDGSFPQAVTRVHEWARANSEPIPSASTSRYVAARQSLPIAMLQAVNNSLCDQFDRKLLIPGRWRGKGAEADTPANQAEYPQPSAEEPSCGLPVIGLSDLIDLSHGSPRDLADSITETGGTNI